MNGRTLAMRRAIAAAASALALVACGITPDTTPRDIDQTTQTGSGKAAVGTDQIFLVEPDAGGAPARLVSVQRDVDATTDLDPTPVLDALFAGPNGLELQNSITTVLPTGLELVSWSTRSGGVVSIDLPEEFAQLTGTTLVLGLAQIVHTMAAVDGVNGVRITVGGASNGWPDVNGTVQTDPLTEYDYPGLVRTRQPAFPAVPSD